MDIEVHLGRGVTARYGHWGPFWTRWDRQIWTLRSNFRLWENRKWTLRSKIWNRKVKSWVLRSKNILFEVVSRQKWLWKIFLNIPGSFRHFIPFSYHFKGKSIKINKNRILVQNPSLLSPLGGLFVDSASCIARMLLPVQAVAHRFIKPPTKSIFQSSELEQSLFRLVCQLAFSRG